jgi:hypothetical protein
MFDTPESASLWFDIFNGVLLTGAFLVAVGTWGTIKIASIKEKFADERIATNEAETGRAIADSDAAKEGTAKANERIAELSVQAEQLRRDTAEANASAAAAGLKLAQFRKARLVSPEDSEKIVEATKPFAGTNFDIGHAPIAREQWDFLWQLEPVFAKAGWVFRDWTGPQVFSKLNWTMTPHWYGVANVLNVSVQVDPKSRDELLPAAEALVKVLNEIGITAALETIGSTSANFDAVARKDRVLHRQGSWPALRRWN